MNLRNFFTIQFISFFLFYTSLSYAQDLGPREIIVKAVITNLKKVTYLSEDCGRKSYRNATEIKIISPEKLAGKVVNISHWAKYKKRCIGNLGNDLEFKINNKLLNEINEYESSQTQYMFSSDDVVLLSPELKRTDCVDEFIEQGMIYY